MLGMDNLKCEIEMYLGEIVEINGISFKINAMEPAINGKL